MHPLPFELPSTFRLSTTLPHLSCSHYHGVCVSLFGSIFRPMPVFVALLCPQRSCLIRHTKVRARRQLRSLCGSLRPYGRIRIVRRVLRPGHGSRYPDGGRRRFHGRRRGLGERDEKGLEGQGQGEEEGGAGSCGRRTKQPRDRLEGASIVVCFCFLLLLWFWKTLPTTLVRKSRFHRFFSLLSLQRFALYWVVQTVGLSALPDAGVRCSLYGFTRNFSFPTSNCFYPLRTHFELCCPLNKSLVSGCRSCGIAMALLVLLWLAGYLSMFVCVYIHPCFSPSASGALTLSPLVY